MKQKFLFFFLMSFMTLTTLEAQTRPQTILLKKKIIRIPPSSIPLSMGEEIELEAYIDDAYLFVSATEPAEAYITVTSAMSVVASHHVTIGAGVEYQISMSDWTPGNYTLYILCNGELWTGEFEVE